MTDRPQSEPAPQPEPVPQPKPPRKRRLRGFLIALPLVAGLLAYLYWLSRVDIVVSPQTTYITAPVNADGTVNYVAYLDARHSEGVTADNNAAAGAENQTG